MSSIRGPNNEPYLEYYVSWSEDQAKLCNELSAGLQNNMSEKELQQLVKKVKGHYKEYYAAKEGAAKQDVLKMINPKWRSPLEVAFLWIGGWRPTMIFQLAYAQAGEQVESELAEFLNGLDTPNLTAFSAKQLSAISRLQQQKQKEEDVLSHREAVIQQSLGDHPLALLAMAGEQPESISSSSESGSSESGKKRINPVSDTVDEKVKALEELMCDADTLRYEALDEFLTILSTMQAAQYLVAAGQLHVAVHEIGRQKEESGN